MAKKKLETVNVKEKEIVILRFDNAFPVGEADLLKMMKIQERMQIMFQVQALM